MSVFVDPPAAESAMLRIAQWVYRGFSTENALLKEGYQRLGGEFVRRVDGQIVERFAARGYEAALRRVAGNAAYRPELHQLAQHALSRGASYAGELSRRMLWRLRLLPSIAYRVLPVFSGVVGAVLVGIGVLVIGGLVYVNSADRPVGFGPQAAQARGQQPGGPGVTYNVDDYYVFLLPDVSGGSILVGQESALKTTRSCDIAGGGLCGENDPPVRYEIKSPGFKTYDQAAAAWCAELAGKELFPSPVAGDSRAAVYGGRSWIGTAPSCA